MVYESFGVFRKLHQQLQTELQQRPTAPGAGAVDGDAGAAEGGGAADGAPEAREGDVGEDEETGKGGISVGVAPSGSRPAGADVDGLGEGDEGDERDGTQSP